MIFEIGKIFKKLPLSLRDFSIGFVYQSGINLNATQDGIYHIFFEHRYGKTK